MKIKFKGLLGAALLLAGSIGCSENDALKDHFKNPSDVQTSIYWYWISGNISEEGVKKDLHAMKQAGINRAYIGRMGVNGVNTPYKKVPFGGDEWWKITHAALKTATELGIDRGIFNSPGWSQSGGPWIKPEQAMRYLTSVTCQVEGGKKVSIDMKKPADDFQDVKVIAFPAVSAQKELHSGKVITFTS